jgi:hypothetical protein
MVTGYTFRVGYIYRADCRGRQADYWQPKYGLHSGRGGRGAGHAGQQVRELLKTSRRDGFSGHPEYEEAQRAVLEEIQAQVTGAEAWLEKVREALYMAAVASPPSGQGRWTRTGTGLTWNLFR